MGSRTYLPTLVNVAHFILNYVARYRVQINKNLTDSQQALLDALIVAATALLAALETAET